MVSDQWLDAQAEWENPENWYPLGVYCAPRDSRVWVRKRNFRFGWTLNLAHPISYLWMAPIAGMLLAYLLHRLPS